MRSQTLDDYIRVAFGRAHPSAAVALYCASVTASACILAQFYPPRYEAGTPALIVTVALMGAIHILVYVLYTTVFYVLAYLRRIRPQLTHIASGVVLAHMPNLLLQLLILFVPGFARVDSSTGILIPLTSPTSWLSHAPLHSTLVALLNSLDPLNVAKVALLSLVLRNAANLSFGRALIVNSAIVMGLAIIF
jgi:hypothetical protein